MSLRRYLSSVVVAGFLLMGAGTGQGHPTIAEDDPGWDCRTMGNHVCGTTIYFTYADGNIHGYELAAPNRPGCFVEPSNTPQGYEVIYRPDITIGDNLGFEVVCPT